MWPAENYSCLTTVLALFISLGSGNAEEEGPLFPGTVSSWKYCYDYENRRPLLLFHGRSWNSCAIGLGLRLVSFSLMPGLGELIEGV